MLKNNNYTFIVEIVVDPSIKVVNKEFGKNSITLELIPQKPGDYSINVSFYGCCLSKPLDVFGIDIAPEITMYYDM